MLMCNVFVKLNISDFRIGCFTIGLLFRLIADLRIGRTEERNFFWIGIVRNDLFQKTDFLLHRFFRSRKGRDGMNLQGWILLHNWAFSCICSDRFTCILRMSGENVRVSILLQNPEKLISNDWMLSKRMIAKTSQDCFNSFKHCFRHFLKYPHFEVSAHRNKQWTSTFIGYSDGFWDNPYTAHVRKQWMCTVCAKRWELLPTQKSRIFSRLFCCSQLYLRV